MSNTQTIFNLESLPGFFSEYNILYVQSEITRLISEFYTSKKVMVPLDNIHGVMIHIHEHWGRRTMTLDQINNTVIFEIVQDFKNHLTSQRTSNYYLNNEYTLMTQRKSLNTYKMNPRSRSMQFQTTF